MIHAGIRRLALLTGGVVGFVGVVSLLAGLVTGGSILRSVAVGYLVAGSVIALAGAGASLRQPSRRRPSGLPYIEERVSRMNAGAVFVGLGIALIVLGLVLDPRTDLV